MKGLLGTLGMIVLALGLSGCKTEAERVQQSTNPDLKVERLGEVDGCTIYRFRDGGRHYFVRCKDQVTTSERRDDRETEIPTVTTR